MNSAQFSSSLRTPATMPIQIPSSNLPLPPASFSHPSAIFPITQSHSLPTYILPNANFAYLFTNSNSNPPQSLHFLTPIHSHSGTYHQTKQIDEQLPLKKRRYNGNQQSSPVCSPMDVNHDGDDDTSNESSKK